MENAEQNNSVEEYLALQGQGTDAKKDSLDIWGLREEIIKLTVKLQNSETIISLLKEQLELNSSQTGEKHFNPELIVNMAKEIERLKFEIGLTQPLKADMHQCDRGTKRARPHSLDLGTMLSQGKNGTSNVSDAGQQVSVNKPSDV